MVITQADIDATTQMEVLFGTVRCLATEPALIGAGFLPDVYQATIYNRIVSAWYTGDPVQDGSLVIFNPGFREEGKALKDFIMAHLKTLQPEHERKIAGAAYLLSQVVTITE